MPHSENEYKSKKIEKISIEPLEEGFLYEVMIKNKNSEDSDAPCSPCEYLKYSYSSVDEIVAAIKDDLESPHARKGKKPPLGEGGRFKALTHELEEEGAKDPKALAAFIGRKKYR